MRKSTKVHIMIATCRLHLVWSCTSEGVRGSKLRTRRVTEWRHQQRVGCVHCSIDILPKEALCIELEVASRIEALANALARAGIETRCHEALRYRARVCAQVRGLGGKRSR